MRIGVLSGAIKNAGDYLIVQRSEDLIESVFTDCEIIRFNRLESLQNELEIVNTCNALFMAGGPAYLEYMYPDYMPLVDDLNDIKVPIISLGNGWYGKNDMPETLYMNYKFSKETKMLLDRIYKDSKAVLSCRDWYTWRLLKNNGHKNCIMTGCPAWYSESIIKGKKTYFKQAKRINTIYISEPSYTINAEKFDELIEVIKELYPAAKIKIIIHRGIDLNREKGRQINCVLNKYNVDYVDISGKEEGFAEYDKCDLHIGFRLHAHIYNLSMHNPSILIEEDARGIGFNEAVGLKGVKPYYYYVEDDIVKLRDNRLFKNECRDILQMYQEAEESMFNTAFHRIEGGYKEMMSYLTLIKQVIEM